MNLNGPFQTESEVADAVAHKFKDLFKHEFGEEPISIGNEVSDENTPATFFANPTPNEFPILMEDIKLIDSLESAIADLADIRNSLVSVGGIDRATAIGLEAYVPELIQRRPINSFSTHLSITNYQLSLEEIDKKRIGLYAGLIAALLGLIWKISTWLFGKKEGSDAATSSIAGSDAIEARKEITETAAEVAPIVDEAVETIASRNRDNSNVNKAKKEMEEQLKDLLDNTTEGKTIGFLGKNSEIQEFYRLIAGGASDQYKLITERLLSLQKDIDGAIEGFSNSNSQSFTTVLNHMRAVGDFREKNRGINDNALSTGGGMGLNALVPTIQLRNPAYQRGENVPDYILKSGIIHNRDFFDIGTISHFFKDPNGLRYLIEKHDVHSRDLNEIYIDILSLSRSAIVTEFINQADRLENALEQAGKRAEVVTKSLSEYLKKLPSKKQFMIEESVPGIQNTDPVYRDKSAGEIASDDGINSYVPMEYQEPPVSGEGKGSIDEDGEERIARVPLSKDNSDAAITSKNARYADHEKIFRFLENETRSKVREITDWGSVIGFLARDISIINVRLTTKILNSKNKAIMELRKNLTSEDSPRDAKHAAEELDAKLLSVLEMVLQKTRSGVVTMAEKPRFLSSLKSFVNDIVGKAGDIFSSSNGKVDSVKFDQYQERLQAMADTFEKEIDSNTANKLRAIAKNINLYD